MNHYHCVICTQPFTTDKVLSVSQRFCSDQCRQIDKLPASGRFKFEYSPTTRNRVFEVTGWDKPKQHDYHSRRVLRVKGKGSKMRITSKARA